MPGPSEHVPRRERRPSSSDDVPRWELNPADADEPLPRWDPEPEVPRWQPQGRGVSRRPGPPAARALGDAASRPAPPPRVSPIVRPFAWWAAHPWAVLWACVVLSPAGVILLRVVDEAGWAGAVAPLAWLLLAVLAVALVRAVLFSARRSVARLALGAVSALAVTVALLWPVTQVTLGRALCPARAGSDLGVQAAVEALRAWTRGEPGESAWRRADPSPDWRRKVGTIAVLDYRLVQSGCFERVAPIDAGRTWHDFRVTVREGERPALSKVVTVHTAAESGGWKITAIEGPLP